MWFEKCTNIICKLFANKVWKKWNEQLKKRQLFPSLHKIQIPNQTLKFFDFLLFFAKLEIAMWWW